MAFRWSDSRRTRYQGHVSGEITELEVERRCDACHVRSTDTVPLYPPGVPVVPGTGSEIPPFVCRDFRACCDRFADPDRIR